MQMTNGYYTVVAPGTIHPNAQYNVVATVSDVEEVCKMKLTLNGPNLNMIKEIEVPPNATVNVGFEIPNIERGNYKLSVEGVSGLIFTKDANLNFDDNKPAVFVQTDKAVYKPGDLVHFRVVCLDQNIRPANLDKITILIKDAANNCIKQFHNVELTKGVATAEIQLSEFPVLGEWKIEVQWEGETLKAKSFDVDEYVLPKFEVIVEAPKKVLLSDEKLNITVRSKYTFGKNVKGKASVKIASRSCDFFYEVVEKEVEKIIDINGKALVEFNIADLKPESLSKPNNMISKITAIVEEEFTGNKQTGTAELQLVWNQYNINAPNLRLDKYTLIANKTFSYSVSITDFDGNPVSDNKNPVKVSCADVQESFLNEHGIASFELDNTSKWNYHLITVEYRGEEANGSVSKPHLLQTESGNSIEIITETPQFEEPIEIDIKSSTFLKSFVYVVVARGNVVQSDFEDMRDKITKTHRFKVNVSFAMMPKAHIYAYFVHGNDLQFFETCFDVEAQFINNISINAPTQAQPGEDVGIEVITDADSYVGLVAVDQSVLLLKSGNDFDKNEVLKSLNNFKTETPYEYMNSEDPYPGGKAGLITLTNANYPWRPRMVKKRAIRKVMYRTLKRKKVLSSETIQPRIRKDFSETWFIADFPNFTKKDLAITKKIPDTITSWIISAFSLNMNTGFALPEMPTKIQTFRPFFITTNLPYSVKRGEIVTIPIIVFNYLESALDVTITFDNIDNEFKFIDDIIDQKQRIAVVNVESNKTALVNFAIQTEHIGQITLKITAISNIAGDAIHKKLMVEPEGITVFKNQDFYVQTEEGQTFNEQLILNIPKDVVPDSEHIEISLMGDILGSTVCNFDKLIRMPYGCGEQNMVNFVPNILVLLYLENVNQLKPAIVAKAKHYMEVGYQRELTYKHDNGSYSAFGKYDECGSTWLTAYVVRSFHQAMRYIDIEAKILEEGLDFLATTQVSNGSFPENGRLFDASHHNEVGLTAFVLLAFLENKELTSKYEETIKKGFHFIEENIKLNTDDLYATSIALYALRLCQSNVVHETLSNLEGAAKTDGCRKWWTKTANNTIEENCQFDSHDVEITSYIVMTMLDMNVSVMPIIKWLISKRNSNGGFESTQDTVVGLQALVKFAERNIGNSENLIIDFEAGSEDNTAFKSQIKSNKENTLELITQVLPGWVRKVAVTGKGSGTAVLQISYRYNIALEEKKPSFNLATTIEPNSNVQKLHLNVAAEFKPVESDAKQSNMVVMEVSLPSGYTANTDAFDKIKQVDSVKRVETKKDDTNVVIYFDSFVVGNAINVSLEAERIHDISEQKPVPIVIYDYYDNLKRATMFYKI